MIILLLIINIIITNIIIIIIDSNTYYITATGKENMSIQACTISCVGVLNNEDHIGVE